VPGTGPYPDMVTAPTTCKRLCHPQSEQHSAASRLGPRVDPYYLEHYPFPRPRAWWRPEIRSLFAWPPAQLVSLAGGMPYHLRAAVGRGGRDWLGSCGRPRRRWPFSSAAGRSPGCVAGICRDVLYGQSWRTRTRSFVVTRPSSAALDLITGSS